MKPPIAVRYEILSRSDVSAGLLDEMFLLLTRHFEGVTPGQFQADMNGKNLVLLLRQGNLLVGFSSLFARSVKFDGAVINAVYSGDTIVSPMCWRSTALARAWVAGIQMLQDQLPSVPCYWLLLSSGFRTYRFMSVFWREFYPRFDRRTPAAAARLLDQLATECYGTQFDPAKGVVRFTSPQKLRNELAAVPEGRTRNPHVAFFLEKNTGHANGDELVCVAELSRSNLTAAGLRIVGSPTGEHFSNHRQLTLGRQ